MVLFCFHLSQVVFVDVIDKCKQTEMYLLGALLFYVLLLSELTFIYG